MAWVWATWVDTVETAFTRWVRPFGTDESETFYNEMLSLARFFAIPDGLLPADRRAFARSLDDMLSSRSLATGDESRSLARQVLWFPHGSVPSPLVRVERARARATLDVRIVDRLGLGAEDTDHEFGRRLDEWLSSYYRRFPRPPRGHPGSCRRSTSS